MDNDKRFDEVIRVKKAPSSFAMMHKGFLENENLSWKAKGMLAYILSKPDNWKVIVGDLVKNSTDGKTAVYNGLGELKKYGYYDKVPIRDEKGVIDHWESTVYELPKATNPKKAENTPSYPLPGFPEMDDPEMDDPEMDDPYLDNRERNNNYLSNKYFNKNQVSQVSLDNLDNFDNLDRSNSLPAGQASEDVTVKISAYAALIKSNISYADLVKSNPGDTGLIDDIVSIIIDAVLTKGGTVKINGEDKPRELVVRQLLKLTYYDITHTVSQYKSVTEQIKNKKQYLLTILYNCKLEADAHVINAYMSDTYGG